MIDVSEALIEMFILEQELMSMEDSALLDEVEEALNDFKCLENTYEVRYLVQDGEDITTEQRILLEGIYYLYHSNSMLEE